MKDGLVLSLILRGGFILILIASGFYVGLSGVGVILAFAALVKLWEISDHLHDVLGELKKRG